MRTFKRIVSREEAKALYESFKRVPEVFHIKGSGDSRVKRNLYNERVIFQSWIGGNEWSPARLQTQFEMYY